MIRVVMLVDTLNVQGVKETLAEYCEKFGDAQIIDVKEIEMKQMKLSEADRD